MKETSFFFYDVCEDNDYGEWLFNFKFVALNNREMDIQY